MNCIFVLPLIFDIDDRFGLINLLLFRSLRYMIMIPIETYIYELGLTKQIRYNTGSGIQIGTLRSVENNFGKKRSVRNKSGKKRSVENNY